MFLFSRVQIRYFKGRIIISGKRRLVIRRPQIKVRVGGHWRLASKYRRKLIILYRRKRRILKIRRGRFLARLGRRYVRIRTRRRRSRRRRARRKLRRRRRRRRRRKRSRRRRRRRRKRRRRRRRARRRRQVKRRKRKRRGCVMRIRYGRHWKPVYQRGRRFVLQGRGRKRRYIR